MIDRADIALSLNFLSFKVPRSNLAINLYLEVCPQNRYKIWLRIIGKQIDNLKYKNVKFRFFEKNLFDTKYDELTRICLTVKLIRPEMCTILLQNVKCKF